MAASAGGYPVATVHFSGFSEKKAEQKPEKVRLKKTDCFWKVAFVETVSTSSGQGSGQESKSFQLVWNKR